MLKQLFTGSPEISFLKAGQTDQSRKKCVKIKETVISYMCHGSVSNPHRLDATYENWWAGRPVTFFSNRLWITLVVGRLESFMFSPVIAKEPEFQNMYTLPLCCEVILGLL